LAILAEIVLSPISVPATLSTASCCCRAVGSLGDFGLVSISGPSGGGDDFGGFDLDGEVGKDLGEGLVIDREGEVTDEYSALLISFINVIG
jgi:hypothetical protein